MKMNLSKISKLKNEWTNLPKDVVKDVSANPANLVGTLAFGTLPFISKFINFDTMCKWLHIKNNAKNRGAYKDVICALVFSYAAAIELPIDILPRLKPWDSLESGCHHHTV